MKIRTLKNWQVWLIILASSVTIGAGFGWLLVMIFQHLGTFLIDILENLAHQHYSLDHFRGVTKMMFS